MTSKRSTQHQTGFTIVELMIATLVFSTILLVITYGILRFTSAYYKGVNSSTTQDTARSIMDTVSQAVQFSGSTIVPTDGPGATNGTYFCAADHIFVFKAGKQYMGGTPTAANPGLFEAATDGCKPSLVVYSKGQELLGKHMRIANLQLINNGGQSYTVSIRLAYSSGGDPAHDGDDLLCSPSVNNSCTSSRTMTNFALPDLMCKTQTGSQFCATSALSTTVIQRVASSELSG